MTRIAGEMITEIKRHQHTKTEWKNALIFNGGVFMFPEAESANKEKEYLAGYTQAKLGDSIGRKEAKNRRNSIVKQLRADGWETWTEPESHSGGTSTFEYGFSAARVKS
jgi:hypothetical protein